MSKNYKGKIYPSQNLAIKMQERIFQACLLPFIDFERIFFKIIIPDLNYQTEWKNMSIYPLFSPTDDWEQSSTHEDLHMQRSTKWYQQPNILNAMLTVRIGYSSADIIKTLYQRIKRAEDLLQALCQWKCRNDFSKLVS